MAILGRTVFASLSRSNQPQKNMLKYHNKCKKEVTLSHASQAKFYEVGGYGRKDQSLQQIIYPAQHCIYHMLQVRAVQRFTFAKHYPSDCEDGTEYDWLSVSCQFCIVNPEVRTVKFKTAPPLLI